MAEIEIVLVLLSAAFGLLGFPVAYYMFGRGHQDQQHARLWESYRKWGQPTLKEVHRGVRKIMWRGVALNILLVSCTLLFTVTMFGMVAYLANPLAQYLQLGVVGFFSLALVVVGWFVA